MKQRNVLIINVIAFIFSIFVLLFIVFNSEAEEYHRTIDSRELLEKSFMINIYIVATNSKDTIYIGEDAKVWETDTHWHREQEYSIGENLYLWKGRLVKRTGEIIAQIISLYEDRRGLQIIE